MRVIFVSSLIVALLLAASVSAQGVTSGYLPGKSDEYYSLNTQAMSRGHGFEGRWFRATTAWQNAVEKLIPARRLSR
jgi:hypothetical protein